MHIKQLFDLSGKFAIITGGSRGLGLEIARGLGEAGAHVHITARREQWLSTAQEALLSDGIECSASTCDISRQEDVERMVQEAVETSDRIDILVNNAGVSWGAPTEEMPLDRWRYVLDTNLTGTFLVTQAVARCMIADGGGKIINVSSVAGQRGIHEEIMNASVYHASKGGIDALTRDLAVKWARHNIYVNAVAPSYFPTRMTQGVIAAAEDRIRALSPFARMGAEGELKGVVVFLAAPASNWVTGQVIAVDGGYTAW
ncbi:MAG TPA: SDR family oxidoreductase [Dehalococcoidia bacterium]|nr:SDR family oxidoreductase [Dehalococcoidia bacterium]